MIPSVDELPDAGQVTIRIDARLLAKAAEAIDSEGCVTLHIDRNAGTTDRGVPVLMVGDLGIGALMPLTLSDSSRGDDGVKAGTRAARKRFNAIRDQYREAKKRARPEPVRS